MRRTFRDLLDFSGETLRRCVVHSLDTQSAALAFYALFSLAPLLLVSVSIAGHFFGEGRVHGAIVGQFQGIMGPGAGRAISTLLDRATGPGAAASPGGIAGIVAFVLGSTAVFIQLQEALNRIWEVAPLPGPMLRPLVRRRLFSFALVLAASALVLVSLTLSTGLGALAAFPAAHHPLPVALLTLGNEVLSFLGLASLLALIYRLLPDRRLGWHDVAVGAIASAVLLSTGKWLIASYLGRTTLASQFGVAGSLVVLLLWIYCDSYILLLGAELTAVYSSRYRGRPVTPEAGAAHNVQSS
jgi:membrane protein